MTDVKNLWGEIPKAKKLPNLPNKILKDQGRFLTEATAGVLVGETSTSLADAGIAASLVASNDEQRSFSTTLRIRVPALDNYAVSLLNTEYPAELYPVIIRDQANGSKYTCEDVEAYEQALLEILSSGKVKNIIATLLAQASEIEEERQILTGS